MAFVFALGASARAQATGGSITGTVTREARGTMPGVRVSLSDQAKTVTREVTTDTDGVYNLPALPPAVYEIILSAPGFVTQTWTGFTFGVPAFPFPARASSLPRKPLPARSSLRSS